MFDKLQSVFNAAAARLTHLEQSATSRHFSTISTDFPKKRLKPFSFSRSFPSYVPYDRCDFVLGLAAFELNALFVK